MKAQRRVLPPAKEIVLELFGNDEEKLAEFLVRHTYFLSADRIRRRYETTGTAAWYPGCVSTLR